MSKFYVDVQYQTDIAMQNLQQARNETWLSSKTMQDKAKIIREQAIGAVLQNMLTSAKIDETKANINKMAEDIAQNWQRVETDTFREEIKAKYPSLFEVAGNVLDESIRGIKDIIQRTTGNNMNSQDRTIKR